MSGCFENPWTPAHQAVESGDHAELTRLLDAGADPEEVCCGMTLLLHAIDVEGDGALQSGSLLDSALTAILLAYGADPTATPDGETPRGLAISYNHDMAVRLLDRHTPALAAPAGRPRSGLWFWRRSRKE
ncbi:ankyrin repeat domain-containing protein [Streptomyces sp. NPDC056883]|uniref:ankyrin repeat domain-containing protein n=1 Tax=Streptomyces sp. NPDC056883 TaxID=3345959 RepID=UPI0036BFFD05